MHEHVTYHLVSDDLINLYRYYAFDDQGAEVAAQHCDGVGMSETDKQQLLDLIPHFADPADFPFDQTHGFNIALTQGFFGTYFYLHDAQLSRLGEAIAPYTSGWQAELPDWDATQDAQNHVLSQFSSGVFIPQSQVARLMSDAHSVPELAEALSIEFPGDKLSVLWSALQAAHDTGAGLLEAAGAIEPCVSDLAASRCFTRQEKCDTASLAAYVTAQTTSTHESLAPSSEPVVPELPVPPHLADRVVPNAGERLPSTPSLTERLREKRGERLHL